MFSYSFVQIGNLRVNLSQIAYTKWWPSDPAQLGSPVLEIIYSSTLSFPFRGKEAETLNRILEQKSEKYEV